MNKSRQEIVENIIEGDVIEVNGVEYVIGDNCFCGGGIITLKGCSNPGCIKWNLNDLEVKRNSFFEDCSEIGIVEEEEKVKTETESILDGEKGLKEEELFPKIDIMDYFSGICFIYSPGESDIRESNAEIVVFYEEKKYILESKYSIVVSRSYGCPDDPIIITPNIVLLDSGGLDKNVAKKILFAILSDQKFNQYLKSKG